MYENMIVFRIF